MTSVPTIEDAPSSEDVSETVAVRSCFGRPLVRWVASHSCGGMVQPNLAASVSAMEWSARMCPFFSSFWRYDA